MALQPIDRKHAKHGFNTSKRTIPTMVNRTNKSILPELSPQHVSISRFQFYQREHQEAIQEEKRWMRNMAKVMPR